MNRKNLTAAVLAGLAGVAGIAGAVQADGHFAVNMNPDGLGEVLLYPYYTTNDGNTTLITVVNTTDSAKAVKVRFLEGYNSREVLDFNLYLSKFDVWVAALADSSAFGAPAGVPHLFTPDTSCTVPYLYGYGIEAGLNGGLQPLLSFAFTGDFADGGPTDISRASEGYVEIIEMGDMLGNDGRAAKTLGATDPGRMNSEKAATHTVKKDADTGETYVEPYDCWLLEDNWTEYRGSEEGPDDWSGWWLEEALANCEADDTDDVDPDDVGKDGVESCGQNDGVEWGFGPEVNSLGANTGGLFGGAGIINVAAGTMVSYDARAVQGFDNSGDGLHFYPGTIHPSLNDGDAYNAVVFLGKGEFTELEYDRSVDAISAVFMHDEIANTFVIQESIAAATEWVVTFPTKAWYADTLINDTAYTFYLPDEDDEVGCNGWDDGDVNPFQAVENGGGYVFACEDGENNQSGGTGEEYDDWAPGCDFPDYAGENWEFCDVVRNTDTDTVAPFTTTFDGEACEPATLAAWDREESPTVQGGSVRPPIVSPAPPGSAPPGEAPFELCYEVNLLRFGAGSVFGGETVTDGGLTLEVDNTDDAGWARITLAGDDGAAGCVACGSKSDGSKEQHVDAVGMRGLPVTGFAAETYTNGNVTDGVLANYGGLFNHKGSVRCDFAEDDGDCTSRVDTQ